MDTQIPKDEWPPELSDVAPPSALSDRLASIEACAAQGASVEQLAKMVTQVAKTEQVLAKAPIWEPGQLIFRARKMSAKPNAIRDISYPPAEHAKRGRLNEEGHPIFYGTHGSFGPCLYECAAHPGDRFVIGKWELTERLLMNQLGYHKKLNLTRPARSYPSIYIDDETSPEHEAFLEWLCDVFTRPMEGRESVYRLSNALAKFVLGPMTIAAHGKIGSSVILPGPDDSAFAGQVSPAGVIYPSIATNTFGDNVAIKPEHLDKNFKFIAAIWMEVLDLVDGNLITSHTQGLCTGKVGEVAFADQEGALEWSPHPTNSPVFSRYPVRR